MLKRIVKKLLFKLPVGKYIFLESFPDLSDNTKAVFDRMLELGLDKKYKFVWLVADKRKIAPENKHKNIIYIDTKTRFNNILFKYYGYRAKCLISCNIFLVSRRQDQKSFYLTHGTAIKSIHSYYTMPRGVDYLLVASEGTKSMMAYELMVDIDKVVATGFPRNDVFSDPPRDIHPLFEGDYDKIIVWYPTFRQHKLGRKKTACSNALPILYDPQHAIELNRIAEEKKVLIVIKPHFVQDISCITKYNLKNIKFIDDSFFTDNKISSYEFIGNCDAMITDYSSVYFDYLLCNKPIALIWEDIEQYKQDPGFSIDMEYYGKAAEKIYNIEDFKNFIVQLADGHDDLEQARKEINTWANISDDGKNTERVVDFIIDKANL